MLPLLSHEPKPKLIIGVNAEQRAQERARVADAKERERLFHEGQQSEASSLSREIENRIDELTNLLGAALSVRHEFTLIH